MTVCNIHIQGYRISSIIVTNVFHIVAMLLFNITLKKKLPSES
jgi:hypothetical protein